jgi:6-phosphogluconolactonase
MRFSVCLLALWLLANPVPAATYVYVALSDAHQIAIYKMDAKTGALEYAESVKMDGQPGALATDPQQKYLFAALWSNKKILSHQINPDGTLKLIDTRATDVSPVYLSTDRAGKFLLSAAYSEGKVLVHAIGKDGTLHGSPAAVGNAALVEITTAKMAHAIVPDPSDKFVFVPHTGPNVIFQFLFDAKTGKLMPNAVPKVQAPPDAQPRHLCFHPKKNIAYTSNEKGGSVTAYQFDPDKGQLTPLQTLSTLPKDFKGNNTCADIHMTPSGHFLYVSNRGHDSLAGFAVDQETGKLTALGQTATEKMPWSFAIDPSGQFLYAAGRDSGKVAAYRIDKTGGLKRFATYDVGKGPAWVQIVALP